MGELVAQSLDCVTISVGVWAVGNGVKKGKGGLDLDAFLEKVSRIAELIAQGDVPPRHKDLLRDFEAACRGVQLATFEVAINGMLKLPLEEPGLGIRPETREENLRAYMEPLIAYADEVSRRAVWAAVENFAGPFSELPKHYLRAARAQTAKKAQAKRKNRRGGRPSVTRWRDVARALWRKAPLLTASEMLEKLEAKAVVLRDGDDVVFLDDLGLRTDEKRSFKNQMSALNTLKNQTIKG